MIERHWKGVTKVENANSYVQHLLEETFPELAKIEGFKKASILQSTKGNNIEFLVVTVWESINSIEKFAGKYVTAAVVPLKVQKLMTNYEPIVHHYELVKEYNPQ